MSLIIYQVGNLPIYHALSERGNKGVTVDADRGWRVPVTELNDIGGQTQMLPNDRRVPEALTLKIKGAFFETGLLTADYFMESLKSIGGLQNIPCVAFKLTSQTNGADPVLQWYVTYGTIKDVKVSYQYKDDEQGMDVYEVDIEFMANLYWEGLDVNNWEYRSFENREFNDVDFKFTESFGITPPPRHLSNLRQNYFFYKWYDTSSLHPDYWYTYYTLNPDICYSTPWGGLSTNFVNSFPSRWSGVPNSLYAFRNIKLSDVLSIEVVRPIGLFKNNKKTYTATLTASELDTTLRTKGYFGLRSSDIVVTGKVSPLPAYLIREGNVLPVLVPFTKQDLQVGQLERGVNKISYLSTSSAIQFTQLHFYTMA